MRKISFILPAILTIFLLSCKQIQGDPRILLVTGGHSFDTTAFYEFFFSVEGIEIDTISQPRANEFLTTDEGKKYDVYVFYDMWDRINESQKQAYRELTDKGKGFLFLHHSLVSYQDWPEFKNIIGGQYHEPREGKDPALFSNYKHDIELEVKVIDPSHPVTKSMDSFTILDEGYGNLDLNSNIHPLLSTRHHHCHPIVGWTNEYSNSKIVYLIFGHDKNAYQDEDFRQLIKNSVDWLGE